MTAEGAMQGKVCQYFAKEEKWNDTIMETITRNKQHDTI